VALDYRLRGDSFALIAQKMGINISTAHDYVVRCLENVAPRETKEAVLQLELQRLDQLQGAVSDAAHKGDTDAIKATLSIMRMRGRYLGLIVDGKNPGVNVSIGTDDRGYEITVIGVRSHHAAAATPPELPPTIEHWPAPPTKQ
jgi:hypothetical protein